MEGDPGAARSVEGELEEEERRDRKEVSEDMEEERTTFGGEAMRLLARSLMRVEVDGGTTV